MGRKTKTPERRHKMPEERRKELAKQAKMEAEDAKVVIRNARKDGNSELKKMDISEDLEKNINIDIQELTDTHVKRADAILSAKEKEIMTV